MLGRFSVWIMRLLSCHRPQKWLSWFMKLFQSWLLEGNKRIPNGIMMIWLRSKSKDSGLLNLLMAEKEEMRRELVWLCWRIILANACCSQIIEEMISGPKNIISWEIWICEHYSWLLTENWVISPINLGFLCRYGMYVESFRMTGLVGGSSNARALNHSRPQLKCT